MVVVPFKIIFLFIFVSIFAFGNFTKLNSKYELIFKKMYIKKSKLIYFAVYQNFMFECFTIIHIHRINFFLMKNNSLQLIYKIQKSTIDDIYNFQDLFNEYVKCIKFTLRNVDRSENEDNLLSINKKSTRYKRDDMDTEDSGKQIDQSLGDILDMSIFQDNSQIDSTDPNDEDLDVDVTFEPAIMFKDDDEKEETEIIHMFINNDEEKDTVTMSVTEPITEQTNKENDEKKGTLTIKQTNKEIDEKKDIPQFYVIAIPDIYSLIGLALLFIIIILPIYTLFLVILMYRYTTTVIPE